MKLLKNRHIEVDVPPAIERAMRVAKEAKKGLLVVTPEPLLSELKNLDGYNVAVEKPCPCGFYGSQLKVCICKPAEVERYRSKLQQKYSAYLWAEGWISKRHIQLKNLSDPCKTLLLHYAREMQATTADILKAIETAVAIAKFDESDVIKPEHIAEAISYRCKA